MRLRHRHPIDVIVELGSDLGHKSPHRGLGHHRAVLLDQSNPHTMGGVTLLARRRPILH
jgi:hypothetical protein